MSDDDQPAAPTRGRHYDWPAIKAAYVEGVEVDGKLTWPTLDESARAHEALPHKVRERAAAEGWTDERATFQRRVELERREERSAELARMGADIDLAALRIARSGFTLTAARLQELTGVQAARQEEQAGNGEGTTPAPMMHTMPLDALELQRLGLAARRWFDIAREAIGDVPTTSLHISTPDGVQVEHSGTVETRDTRTREILLALVDARVLPEALRDAIGNGDELGLEGLLALGSGDGGPSGDSDDTEAH